MCSFYFTHFLRKDSRATCFRVARMTLQCLRFVTSSSSSIALHFDLVFYMWSSSILLFCSPVRGLFLPVYVPFDRFFYYSASLTTSTSFLDAFCSFSEVENQWYLSSVLPFDVLFFCFFYFHTGPLHSDFLVSSFSSSFLARLDIDFVSQLHV